MGRMITCPEGKEWTGGEKEKTSQKKGVGSGVSAGGGADSFSRLTDQLELTVGTGDPHDRGRVATC